MNRSSPWGAWDVAGSPIVLDGINCTFHAITNADGRYGGNDSAINYGGSYALVAGASIVLSKTNCNNVLLNDTVS